MKFSYYKRIFQAYLSGGNSQLTFWHGTPEVNEAAFEQDSQQYYMAFRGKANYAGPFDDKGIPMLDYRGVIGAQYNPIAIAQYGLGCANLFFADGDDASRRRFLVAADWMAHNLARNKHGLSVWNHHFDFEYFQTLKAPWYSGLAQGQGISLLVRAYQYAGDEEYLAAAGAAFEAMVAPIDDGGCLFVDEAGDWWIEEYITEPVTHIVNGFMWALWGAYDLGRVSGVGRGVSDSAAELWEKGVVTLEKNLKRFDTGYWSKYDLAPLGMSNPASPFYHKLHLVQLDIMHRLTANKVFADYSTRWASYGDDALNRARAYAKKALFKLAHF